MIWATLGDRDRRALLIGAAIMLGLTLVFRGLPAWRTWRSAAHVNAREAMSRAARTDALLTTFPFALDELQARTAQVVAMGPVFLTDETSTGAASNLTAFVGDLARQSLVRIDAVDTRFDSSKSHVLPRVAVNVQATTDIVGLSSFLRGLEQGPTLLAIRRLSVRPQNADAPPDQAEMLSIQVTIEGLALLRTSGNAP